MQLSRPPNRSRTVYVKLQEYQDGEQVNNVAFSVYEVSAKKLKKFLMEAVEKGSSPNGRN
jgi:hypothetical protein